MAATACEARWTANGTGVTNAYGSDYVSSNSVSRKFYTNPGDIVLYQGDKISLFYGSHSWSYTKIGKIDDVDSNKLKEVLGSGDATLIFSLK